MKKNREISLLVVIGLVIGVVSAIIAAIIYFPPLTIAFGIWALVGYVCWLVANSVIGHNVNILIFSLFYLLSSGVPAFLLLRYMWRWECQQEEKLMSEFTLTK